MDKYVGEVIPSWDPRWVNRWRGVGADGRPLTPDQMPGVRSLRGEALNPGLEMIHTRLDGSEMWARVMSVPLRDEHGEVSGVVFVVADIDASKRIEAELRDAKTRLEAALVNAEIGTWTWELPGGHVKADANIARLFGVSEEEAQHGTADLFIARLHPDDQPIAVASLQAAFETGAGFSIDARVPREGGDRWVGVRGRITPSEDGLTRMFAGAVFDITERKRAEQATALLINELNHRVKNTLAVVQSMAAQGASLSTNDPKHFAVLFSGRLRALARAHDVLTRTQWAGASLKAIVTEALAPFVVEADTRILADGPDIVVSSATAVVLSMALHELGTNAVKYGALSSAYGQIDVAWSTDGAMVSLDWIESGGPPIGAAPSRKGFGSRMVTDGLAHQLDASVKLQFPPEGLRYSASFPLGNSVRSAG